jgi:hypothetical protein
MRRDFDREEPSVPQPKGRFAWRLFGALVPGGRVMSVVMPTVAVVFSIAFLFCWFGWGFYNPYTPPGYAGYVTKGAFFGSQRFVDVQYGPTSPGAGWLLRVSNIPLTTRTFVEDFSGNDGILSADGTRIEFAVEFMTRIRKGKNPAGVPWVKLYFETLTTVHAGDDPETIVRSTYEQNLKPIFRGYVRQKADSYAGLSLQDSMGRIQTDVFNLATALTANMPVEVTQVTIGRIHYPDSITNQNEQNQISDAETQQEAVRVQLQKKDALMDVIDAWGLKESMNIVTRSITPCWLQFKALEAEQLAIQSNTPTNIMIPVGAMGVPVVSTQHTCKGGGGAGSITADPPGFTLPDVLHNIDLAPTKAKGQ